MSSFLLGIVITAAWFFQRDRIDKPETAGDQAATSALSETTRGILQRLDTPIEVRLYAPADTASLPPAHRNFAARVQQLLFQYDQAAGGKLRLTRADPRADAKAKAEAGTLGLLPLSVPGGDVFYLGIAVEYRNRTETLPQLSPEWEAALESDLSRAIARLSASAVSSTSPPAKLTAPAPIDATVSEDLLRAFPNLQSQSFEEIATVLRSNALTEFKAAAAEMQDKLEAAQKELAAKQPGQSESEHLAAVRSFQKLQQEQSARLGVVTARLQERITTLQRMKGIEPLSGTLP
jgi:hypothetical protein